METLPKRLAAVAALIPSGKVVADIGTDHGFLPVFLVKKGIAPRVIASDIHRGPFQKALNYVHFEGLEENIEIRLGNGLDILSPGEAQVVVIAGLGGHTLVDILAAGSEVLQTVETLVLNPATHQNIVRQWLVTNGWCLMDEDLVEDQGRLYQIILTCQGQQPEAKNWTELQYDIGPIIVRKRHPLLKEYLERKLKKYEKAAGHIESSHSIQGRSRLEELKTAIDEVRGLYDFLSGGQENGNL